MIITKLTTKLLPEFLFLMDAILASDGDPPDYKAIVRTSEEHNLDINLRTVQRAFKLRRFLKGEETDTNNLHAPSKNTLDVLTLYYYGGNPDSFRDLVEGNGLDVSQEMIKQHYESNKPSEEFIRTVFNMPKKLSREVEQIEETESLLHQIERRSLEEVLGALIDTRFKELQEKLGPKALKEELVTYIEHRLEQQQKRKKRSLVIYKFLGRFGFLFISVPVLGDFKATLLDNFLDTALEVYEFEGGDEEYDTESFGDV